MDYEHRRTLALLSRTPDILQALFAGNGSMLPRGSTPRTLKMWWAICCKANTPTGFHAPASF